MTTPLYLQVREAFNNQDLRSVFKDALGWDTKENDFELFQLQAMALRGQKVASLLQGVAVFLFDFDTTQPVTASLQNEISRAVGQRYAERLVIIQNANQSTWLWPKATSSGALTHEKIDVQKGEMPLFLAQRLSALAVSSADLFAGLSVSKLREKLRGSFDTSKVTKKFYDQFRRQHQTLAASIQGLTEEESSSYATVLLNRLMFIYFLQKKEFLNGDPNYLRTCYSAIHRAKGAGHFYSFYRDLLLILFFERLNKPSASIQDQNIARIVGNVPYVNGGIFGETDLERTNEISVPDEIFDSIFRFFDSFTWHLDTRPTGKSDEINPEVIGYIFEQYINFTAGGKKENGAYYTKADVTGHMIASTLVPRILDLLVERGFDPLSLVYLHPERYIHESMLKGYDTNCWRPCPQELIDLWEGPPSGWDKLDTQPADPDFLLPNETWVEMFHRRSRVDTLLKRLSVKPLVDTGQLITENLNASQLLIDVLQQIDEPDDLEELWAAISTVSVIDPTCGSGAFLFAALETLESVYSTILDRALDVCSSESSILKSLEGHPNQRYFIRKHAARSNLYGTDLMADAIETAKLRIFLALVSCLDHPSEIEPLPDLDFNLKSGNLVTGFLRPNDNTQIDGDLFAESELLALEPEINSLVSEMAKFASASEADSGVQKSQLVHNTKIVSEKASRILWRASWAADQSFEDWMNNFKPMHWFIEFPQIIARGGFDVVVGNPPYIGKRSYDRYLAHSIRNFRLGKSPDFFGVCYERSLSLLAENGRHSFVVMLSLAFSDGFGELRRILTENEFSEWWGTFGHRPEGLFTGPGVKNTILTIGPKGNGQHTTQHNVFDSNSRQWLFQCLEFSKTERHAAQPIMRGGVIQELIEEISKSTSIMGSPSGSRLGIPPTSLYWMPVLPGIPPILNPDLTIFEKKSSRTLTLELYKGEDKSVALAVLAGKIGFAWWSATADNFDVAKKDTLQPRAFVNRIARGYQVLEAAEKVFEAGRKNLIQTLYAGKLLINIRWSSARLETDMFDQLVVETILGNDAWRRLNIWYRKAIPTVLESPGNTKNCEASFAESIWRELNVD